ncbi:MAG: nuclear transport factor 2 family protein [Ilumatobacter sp.]|nr:MAG: nuclear transport factor 2 family protein [Ilumatobacter sp.]
MDEDLALRLTTRWWDEVWRDAQLDVIDEIFADPFVRHSGVGTQVVARRDYKSMIGEFQRTLCRPQTTIDDRTISGDRIWTRATSRGLNRETGESTVLTWMLIQRIAGDRIAEHWSLTMRGIDWAV